MTMARAAYGRTPKCSPMLKDVRLLTAGQINRELDALEAKASKLCSKMIACGRGHERPSDTRAKNDPLSLLCIATWDRQADLRMEISLRYGPGEPSRLPARGFGPRKL